MKKQTITKILGLASIVLAGSAQADIVRYDPGLGSFPEAQGFIRYEALGTFPTPILTNGVFHQLGQTGSDGYQFWYTNTPTALNFSNTPYALEVTLHVIFSNYDPNGGGAAGVPRSGYYLELSDESGRTFTVGLSSGGITISTVATDDPRQGGLPFRSFNTTDAFHTYWFQIAGGKGSLFIDGTFFASVPLGAAGQSPTNRVLFGDASHVGVSETELRLLRFQSLATTLTVQPLDTSQVRLSWNSQDNCSYQIQRSPDLVSGSWADWGFPILGNGTTNSITDSLVGTQRFYRLIVLHD